MWCIFDKIQPLIKIHNHGGIGFIIVNFSKLNKTYLLFDDSYINFKGITRENILTVLPRKGDVVANISRMLQSKQTENIYVYAVEGLLREELTKEITDFQILIKVDTKNKTFSVILQDYIQQKQLDFNLDNNFKIENISDIEKSRSNLYVREDISEITYVRDLFNDYKEEILYNSELAYEHLDNEYKEKKFVTLQNFQDYAIANKEYIINSKPEKYQKTNDNGYTLNQYNFYLHDYFLKNKRAYTDR